MVPSSTPCGFLFHKIGDSQPHPKLQSLLCQERVKLYGLQIWPKHLWGPYEQMPMPIKIFGENGAESIYTSVQIFGYPYYLGTLKATNFKFGTHILSINRKTNPFEISGN